MLQTEIRKEYPCIEQDTSYIQEIAADAAALLGYKLAEDHYKKELKLLKTLSILGINLLNLNDVIQYKREHKKEVSARKFAEYMASPDANDFYQPSWTESAIEEYRQPIPEFVLNKAIQVKKSCPEATIFIEYLIESPDPFLVVKITNPEVQTWRSEHVIESYYIEVWDEPKFEHKMR